MRLAPGTEQEYSPDRGKNVHRHFECWPCNSCPKKEGGIESSGDSHEVAREFESNDRPSLDLHLRTMQEREAYDLQSLTDTRSPQTPRGVLEESATGSNHK